VPIIFIGVNVFTLLTSVINGFPGGNDYLKLDIGSGVGDSEKKDMHPNWSKK
jgi:hypothetical protein